MINAGIGEQQVNNILAELNLPTIHHKTLKEREREIGYIIEDVAEKSCNSAIQAEILCSERYRYTRRERERERENFIMSFHFSYNYVLC